MNDQNKTTDDKITDVLPAHGDPLPEGNAIWETPRVGMGATNVVGSDCYPYTIVDVSKNGKRITVQADASSLICEPSGDVSYTYFRCTDGPHYELSLRKDGRWRHVGGEPKGSYFTVGMRHKYVDPHF